MELKKSLLLNFFASSWGKVSSIVIRLVQVPLLISVLGVDDFGRWLVLSSIPAWLTLANMGFGSVAANEMSMAAAGNDLDRAKSIFSTTIALVFAIVCIGSIITISIAPFIAWEDFLKVSNSRHTELVLAVIWFALSIFLSFSAEAYGGRFRAARKAHTAVVLSSFRPWFELIGMVIVLQFSTRFDYLALSMLVATILYLIIMNAYSKRVFPELVFSISTVRKDQFRLLFQKGIAFQAFPLGNALLFQGNLLVVQFVLGPAAVALFGTARTLVRSVNQVMEMINQVIWPELSLLLGAGEYSKAARVHRMGVGLSLLLSMTCLVGLALVGKPLYTWWTDKAIALPEHLLLLFLVAIPFNALWYTSSVVHAACNKHEGLAIRYIIATVLTLIACVALSYYQGIEGAAISTVVVDIILIPYVFKYSLVLTHDSFSDFIVGVWKEFKEAPMLLRKFVQKKNVL